MSTRPADGRRFGGADDGVGAGAFELAHVLALGHASGDVELRVEIPGGQDRQRVVGVTIGDLDASVVAVRQSDRSLDTLPRRQRTLAGGEAVYALGRPYVLRALESRAVERPAEETG